MPGFVLCADDFLCWTDLRPIQIPAMRTRGIPIPSPTPRPTLTVSVLELVLRGAGVVAELVGGGVIEVEVAVMLVAGEFDDAEVVDELAA